MAVAVLRRVADRAGAVVVATLADGRGRRGSPPRRSCPAQEDRIRFGRGAHERHELSRGRRRPFAVAAVHRDHPDNENTDRQNSVQVSADDFTSRTRPTIRRFTVTFRVSSSCRSSFVQCFPDRRAAFAISVPAPLVSPTNVVRRAHYILLRNDSSSTTSLPRSFFFSFPRSLPRYYVSKFQIRIRSRYVLFGISPILRRIAWAWYIYGTNVTRYTR